ncbi:MAG: CHAT domain-containing protein [Gemmatirosa sp.]|nr:CHAT domain-containing protein [Gemmatirosa sp.]
MGVSLAWVALLAARSQAQPNALPNASPNAPPDARAAAVADALRAVERGAAAAHGDTLRTRLAAHADDRVAALGLATIARLTYAYPLADSLYGALIAGADDSTRVHALLGHGQSLGARGFVVAADSLFGQAVAAAARMPAARAEAYLGRAGARSRLLGASAAIATLDTARRALDAAGTALAAREAARLRTALLCAGASQRVSVGASGVMAAIDSGLAVGRAGGAPLRAIGMCHFSRAQEYVRIGDMGRANAALDSAADALQRAGDRATVAAAFQWRGYVDVTLGDYEGARAHLGVALAEGTASEALRPTAWALLNVGETSRAMGDAAEATGYFQRATAIFARLGDERGAASARASLAMVALAADDTAGARAAHAENRRWAARSGDWQVAASSLQGLSAVAARERDWPAAETLLDSAASLTLARGGEGWDASLTWQRGSLALLRGDGARAERALRAVLPGFVPSQGNQRFRLLAGIAEARLQQADTAGADSVLRAASVALDAWRASLSDARLRSLAYQLSDAATGSVERVIAGVAASGRVRAAFELAEGRRARSLRDALARAGATSGMGRATMALPEVAAALPERAALALVVAGPGDAPSTLFVVTRGGAAARLLPPDDSLRALTERLRARVEDGMDASAPMRALGEAVFGAGGAWLPRGIDRLVVVPDGALHRAPLALLNPDGRGPLGERVALSTAPSATVAALLRARPRDTTRAPRVLALGDPSFATARLDSAAGEPPLALTPLPRSADEARAAARLTSGSRLLLGADASEAALRALPLTDYSIVHLATHAYVHDARPWAALVALAPGGGHDGFLRASELASLRLDADLVVLSACETARGSVIVGEGVQGFTASLLAAGARAVVATEWALSDGEAARGMDAFYRGLRAGLPVDEALRRARHALRRAGAPPREWAAFAVVGDGAVRPIAAPARGWLARLMGR